MGCTHESRSSSTRSLAVWILGVEVAAVGGAKLVPAQATGGMSSELTARSHAAGYGVMYDRVPTFGAANERIGARWRTYVFDPGTTDPAESLGRVLASGASSSPSPLRAARASAELAAEEAGGLAERVARALGVDLGPEEREAARHAVRPAGSPSAR